MFELNQGNTDFLSIYPTLNELNKHKLFDEFNFTPMQITQICFLLQNGQTLDLIY